MPVVKLADGYTISTKDGLCYVLKQKRKPKPMPGIAAKKDEVEEVVGYHSTIAGVIRKYRERLIMALVEDEKLTLQALIERIEETDRKIGKLMSKKGLGELAMEPEKEKPTGEPDKQVDKPQRKRKQTDKKKEVQHDGL